MLAIAGQTAGPYYLTFFLGNPGSNIGYKKFDIFVFKNQFFLIKKKFSGQRRALQLVLNEHCMYLFI